MIVFDKIIAQVGGSCLIQQPLCAITLSITHRWPIGRYSTAPSYWSYQWWGHCKEVKIHAPSGACMWPSGSSLETRAKNKTGSPSIGDPLFQSFCSHLFICRHYQRDHQLAFTPNVGCHKSSWAYLRTVWLKKYSSTFATHTLINLQCISVQLNHFLVVLFTLYNFTGIWYIYKLVSLLLSMNKAISLKVIGGHDDDIGWILQHSALYFQDGK